MAFENKTVRRQKIEYNNANDGNPIRAQLILQGEKKTAASATITITSPDGQTTLQSATAMSQFDSGSIYEFEVDTTTVASWPIDTGYRALVKFTDDDSNVHERVFMFDVVRYLFALNISFDQLIAVDDSIQGMTWAGDEDFSALIDSARDVIHLRLESKVIQDKQMIENMILDSSKIAIPAKFYMLFLIFRAKSDDEKRDSYKKEFEEMMTAVLNSIKYDEDQSGVEPEDAGGIQRMRIYT